MCTWNTKQKNKRGIPRATRITSFVSMASSGGEKTTHMAEGEVEEGIDCRESFGDLSRVRSHKVLGQLQYSGNTVNEIRIHL